MKELKEARERRASLLKECEAIHNQAKTENRSMSAEEEAKFDSLFDKATAEVRNIERLEKMQEISYELKNPANPADPHGETTEERTARESKERNSAVRSYLLHGSSTFTPEQRSSYFSKDGNQTWFEVRATTDPQTITTTGGGYLIQTELDTALTKALKAYGGVRKAAYQFTTTGGNPMDKATIDDTSNKGRLLDINTQVTVNKLTFDKVTFYAYKFSSDEILIPTELLQDEKVDINAYLGELLGERVGRIEADYMTTGTGSGQPMGVVSAATSAALGLTSASAITKANLIDLVYSVDPAYRESGKCGFMFNDKTAKVLYKLSLGTATDLPLFFQNGLGGASNAFGMAPTLFGFPYWINQSMPDIGAATKPVVFGDFSRFQIRDVDGFRMLRLTERYADYDQIAVILLHRCDSRMLTSGAIKYLQMGNT